MLNQLFSGENERCKIICAFFVLTFFISNEVLALKHDFSFATIPSQLIENSKTVIRYRETTLDIRSAGKAVVKVSYAITILKNSAADKAILIIPHNSFTNIRGLKGTVFDQDGKQVERIERDHFFDLSAISGFSTYEDNRVIISRPKYQCVPFTVEYSYEIVYNGILDYPDFSPIDDYNTAIEHAELHITVDDSTGIKYLIRNSMVNCSISKEKGRTSYSWVFENIPSFRMEPYSPPILEVTPGVLLAPKSFMIKGRKGNTDDWKSFGLWYFDLISDRDDLADETRSKIQSLTSGLTDTLEKIRRIYHYFQERTRYVSIQIGLGGWQPIPASEVDRVGYGDCKALTNYMKALLGSVGITSYLSLVASGINQPDIVCDFPANQFNHVILCIPLPSDTIWLECTSQDIPMGYLGTFTDDRTVLLINETGGYLCHTPVYDHRVNHQNRQVQVQITDDLNADVTVNTIMGGMFYDTDYNLLQMDDVDKRKTLMESIPVSDFTLDSYSLAEKKTNSPEIKETLNLKIRNISTKAGDILLIKPNQMTLEKELSSQVLNRKNPVEIRRSMVKTDTVYYRLPATLSVTGSHINQTITSKFGEYRATSAFQGQEIQYTRRLMIYKGKYSKDAYKDFLEFFEKVANADSKKIALKPVQN